MEDIKEKNKETKSDVTQLYKWSLLDNQSYSR